MAITWVKELQKEVVDLVRQEEEQKTEKSLADYWEIEQELLTLQKTP